MKLSTRSPAQRGPCRIYGAALILLSLLAWSCKGDKGDQGPPGTSGGGGGTNTNLGRDENAPGVNIAIVALKGATGPGGTFQAGDKITIQYTVKKDDGSDWDVTEFSRGRALVGGPSFNYQLTIPEVSDVNTSASVLKGGMYEYTLPALPATYPPPLNDTTSFGTVDGELQGQNLLAGTYTVGLYFRFDYTVDDEGFEDVGNVTDDFLFGGASTIQHRELVTQANCNNCHAQLQAHGGMRREVTLCLLCHASGAEDRNTPTVENGTPDVTIDFRVMIHKIHNGSHLPSVLGVATNSDGSRNYAATPKPYEILGFRDSVNDFSDVTFPVWPSLSSGMPRDVGYDALSSSAQDQEDEILTGVVSCDACHGDPDGAGPLPAPADGDLAYEQPSRKACGACHDDIDWSLPYTSNLSTMPPQSDNSSCILCHGPTDGPLDVRTAHMHPLVDPTRNPGVNVGIVSADEDGTNDGDGTFDPGEKIALTFTLTDDAGAEIDPGDVSNFQLVMSGPTNAMNVLLYASVPTAALTGPQPYTIDLPEQVFFEPVGTSTAALDTFTTARTPHWNLSGGPTLVWARTGFGAGNSSLTADVDAPSNFIDVADSTGFARDDFIVVDDGLMNEEYLQIQWVDGNRLWFSSTYQNSPENGVDTYKYGTEMDHTSGATVRTVTADLKAEDVDYSLDTATGTITELVEFGNGDPVFVSYTTDYVVPTTYPLALNDGPDVDEVWGNWKGKSLVDGTYRISLWTSENFTVDVSGQTTTYRATATAPVQDVLFGDADTDEPWDLISSASNCYACHKDIYFHGGSRRGLDACIQCHGTAGASDRPQYRAPGAPETPTTPIKFRNMLHKIHMGAELANASTYTVVGFGSASNYPNNFSTHTYEDVEFPNFPTGTMNCQACHGAGTTGWHVPDQLDHPTEQGEASRSWRAVCGSCHDSDVAQSHIEAFTPPGFVESCTICHGEGSPLLLSVETVHKVR